MEIQDNPEYVLLLRMAILISLSDSAIAPADMEEQLNKTIAKPFKYTLVFENKKKENSNNTISLFLKYTYNERQTYFLSLAHRKKPII